MAAAKTANLTFDGPPDTLVVELGRTVQPGDEFEVPAEVADRLVRSAGFRRKGQSPAAHLKETQEVEPQEAHSEEHVGAPVDDDEGDDK